LIFLQTLRMKQISSSKTLSMHAIIILVIPDILYLLSQKKQQEF
jgi:hypothetical protein